MDTNREARTASYYRIPSRSLVSVEHPAVVQNLDRAVDTLQGNSGIEKILNPAKPDTPAHLILRPEDAMARPIQSSSSQSNNVLLKVTVPKRTGRKRKRGSDEPFTEDTSEPPRRRPAKDLLRSLRDNASSYTVEPVGKVERTHVFRGMPDFVYSTSQSVFTNKFRDCVIPYELDKLKKFDIDMSKGATKNTDLIPPPAFSHETVPFQWMYRQNPGVKQTLGASGQIMTYNTQQPQKVRTHLVGYDIAQVPEKPQDDLPAIETLDRTLRTVVEVVQGLFEQRPAWTRRAIRNYLHGDEQNYLLRHAIPYVGYIFRSGPWRDAIIKLGHDPRSSPEYRHYQTFMFRILPREVELGRDGGGRRHNPPRMDGEFRSEAELQAFRDKVGAQESHVFTGKNPLPRDGRIWMAIDIKDPLLANVLYPPEQSETFLRPKCEIISDGWFGNGTLAKVKTVMRAKIQYLIDDREPSDEEFSRILALPDHANSEADLANFQLDMSAATPRELTMSAEVRSSIKGAPNWRKKHERDPQGQERVKKRGANLKKKVEFQGENEQEQSEGEEEEIERAEMLEEQIVSAWAQREAAENEQNDGEGEDEGEGEGEYGDGNGEANDEDENMDSDSDE